MNDTKQKLIKHIAPCSLLCYTCSAYQEGAISIYSKKLNQYFEGYYEFNSCKIPKNDKQKLNEIEIFLKKLQNYEISNCSGCRDNSKSKFGCIENCPVPSCTKEKNIDFCSECSEFPCKTTSEFYKNINETNYNDWINGNKRIIEIGLIEYFKEKINKSHYKSFVIK